MSFGYRDGVLCAEQAPLDELARRFGTPCYVYSSAAIAAAYGEFRAALRDAIRRLSDLALRPDIVAQLSDIEINPLIIDESGVLALDALVVLRS